ncbi:hypothetical protein As57867_007140, partial [Aphanomyces stellatus]
MSMDAKKGPKKKSLRSSKQGSAGTSINSVMEQLDQYEKSVLDRTRKAGVTIPVVGSTSTMSPSRSRSKLIHASQSKADLAVPHHHATRPLPSSIPPTTPTALKSLDLVEFLEQAIPRDILDDTNPFTRSVLPLPLFYDAGDTAAQMWIKTGPKKAAGLPVHDGAVGAWSNCTVTSYDGGADMFVVSWLAGARIGPPLV